MVHISRPISLLPRPRAGRTPIGRGEVDEQGRPIPAGRHRAYTTPFADVPRLRRSQTRSLGRAAGNEAVGRGGRCQHTATGIARPLGVHTYRGPPVSAVWGYVAPIDEPERIAQVADVVRVVQAAQTALTSMRRARNTERSATCVVAFPRRRVGGPRGHMWRCKIVALGLVLRGTAGTFSLSSWATLPRSSGNLLRQMSDFRLGWKDRKLCAVFF